MLLDFLNQDGTHVSARGIKSQAQRKLVMEIWALWLYLGKTLIDDGVYNFKGTLFTQFRAQTLLLIHSFQYQNMNSKHRYRGTWKTKSPSQKCRGVC